MCQLRCLDYASLLKVRPVGTKAVSALHRFSRFVPSRPVAQENSVAPAHLLAIFLVLICLARRVGKEAGGVLACPVAHRRPITTLARLAVPGAFSGDLVQQSRVGVAQCCLQQRAKAVGGMAKGDVELLATCELEHCLSQDDLDCVSNDAGCAMKILTRQCNEWYPSREYTAFLGSLGSSIDGGKPFSAATF